MKYLRYIRISLHIVSSLFLTIILGFICFHISDWVKTGDVILAKTQETMGSVQTAANTGNLAATQALDLLGSATKLVDHTTVVVDNLNSTISQLNSSIVKIDGLTNHVTMDLDSITGGLNNSLYTFDSSLQDLNEELKISFDQIPATIIAARDTMDASTEFIKGPLTDTLGDAEGVLTPTGKLMTDVQVKTHQYFFPAKQSKKQLIWNAAVGAFQLSEPSYYFVNLLRGK